MKPDLIVIANSTQAHLFIHATEQDRLIPLTTVENPEGRHRISDLVEDFPTHAGNGVRPTGVDFTLRIDPRRKRHLQFARLLAQRVEEVLTRGECEQVALFSSCPFLGQLRSQLSPSTKRALRACVDTDLTELGPYDLERRIGQELQHASADA